MPPVRIFHHAFVLALLALLARAMVPAGWMPSASPDGTPVFAMCSEGKAASGWVDDDGQIHKKGDDPDTQDDDSCAFAAPAPTTIVAPSSPILPPTPVVALRSPQAFEATPGRGLAAPPPPATGPPILI